MTTKEEWGNVCWYLFHSLSFKLKDNQNHIVGELMSLCHNITLNLPCPDCSDHANQTFNMAKRSGIRITNREEMQHFWWQFHNIVNRRLRKSTMTFECAQEMYSKARLFNIVNRFLEVFGRNIPGERSMMYTMSRRNAVRKMFDFIKANQSSFELN